MGELVTARYASGPAVWKNPLVVVGGKDDGDFLDTMEVYGREQNTWLHLHSILDSTG